MLEFGRHEEPRDLPKLASGSAKQADSLGARALPQAIHLGHISSQLGVAPFANGLRCTRRHYRDLVVHCAGRDRCFATLNGCAEKVARRNRRCSADAPRLRT